MPLSRLDNFLKNVRGNIIYVNPNDLDATDDVTNQGNSMAKPFVTIQRALIEAARFSYQAGLDNDRFGKTTIMLSPGEHYVDNRPGWIPVDGVNYKLRNGVISSDFTAFSSTSNFDVKSSTNDLYKLNSVHGGVIIPRGTSIVGQDLRKTKIRPLYVPDPTNANIERSAIFRVTGGTYFWQFTIFDGDPTGTVYKNYSDADFVPNFSHHKLTCFEYADGRNNVYINDSFIVNSTFTRTDLEMYYEKVGLAYGSASGRAIQPDFPSSGLDIQPKIDEYRIVGPASGSVGISSIKSGDGSTASKSATVTLNQGIAGLNVDTAIQINGATDSAYNGTFLVNGVTAVDNDGNITQFTYNTAATPTDAFITPASATVQLDTDTVTSASPYIFNISLRSVFGMCGMHADGSKADGFKSMVVAQFTAVSLQKDDNAFVKYDPVSGSFLDRTSVDNIHSDSEAKYKPSYYNFHIKASNNSVCQLVSIFAIGFAQQFVTESGGDFSVTNSNSNFGQNALVSKGYRDEAFRQDDVGYISHIIPPRLITTEEFNLEYEQIDVSKTVSVGNTSRLYLYQRTNLQNPPSDIIQGYRIGARANDQIKVGVATNGSAERELTARIVMPNTAQSSNEVTAFKRGIVGRVGTSNSITSNIITFNGNHQFITGETIRFISDNARLPDGIDNNKVYFAIAGGSLNPDQIKVASSLNESLDDNEITINNLGGTLMCESRVSDKISNGIGHPIQYDTSQNQWYVNVSGASTENTIYSNIVSLGSTYLGAATQRTYITRNSDTRSLSDKNYKFRYVIPSASGITSARAPRLSYILEESNDVTGANNTEVQLEYSPTTVTMNNVSEMRNFRFIKNALYNSGLIYVDTERDHGLTLGSQVQLNNITSTINPTGIGNSGFNKLYTVAAIPSSTQFVVQETVSNPGTFTNNTSLRTTALPTFKRLRAPNNYYIYDVDTVKEYKAGVQDGVYYLTIVDATSTPTIAPFTDRNEFAFSQPIQRLFPQYNRDNINSDPQPAIAYAPAEKLGSTVIDDVQHSITRTTVDRGLYDLSVGAGITDIVSSSTGLAHTIFTSVDHSFNRITTISVNTAGAGYGNGTGGESLYNATLSGSATGSNASARITVNASGEITSAEVMNPGTNYNVGDILTVSGTATTTGFSAGSLRVDNIYNNVGDTVRVSGITSFSYKGYNQLYRVTGIGTVKEIQVESLNVVNGASTSGIGATVSNISFVGLTGPSIQVSSLVYDNVTGLGTVTTSAAHNFRTNNQVVLSGATGAGTTLFSGAKLITQVVGLTTFIAKFEKTTVAPPVAGTIRAYPPGLVAQAGVLSLYDENFGGRVLNVYNNLSCNLVSDITNATTDEISITNLTNFDLKIGDYLRIDDEMMRIKTTVTGNPVKVFRGLFDTQATSHVSGSVVSRSVIAPLELRRPSYTRASGHTFEYLGYGPGNYSTALPQKQAGQPDSASQLNSQRMNTVAGVNVFTGMNDSGDFFIGNKRITSSTGKEEVFDTPVPSITGEDVTALGTDIPVDVIDTTSLNVGNTLQVEGGTSNNLLSQFDGPVLFNSKVTVTDNLEVSNLFLQGNANVSRKYTVGISTPTTAGTAGDVVWKTAPNPGDNWGWVYTTDNQWYPFGYISNDVNLNVGVFDQIGIATTSPGDCTLKVGSGTSLFCVDSDGVGIGTTANGLKFRVKGESRFDGVVVATAFTGDGSGLLNLQNDSLWANVSGVGTGLYPLNNLNVGVGTENPSGTYTLELGTAGTGKTDLYVSNGAQFIGTARFDNDVTIAGKFTATNFDINSSSSNLTVGVLTATNIKIGIGGTILTTTANGVGINSTSPTTELDVDGRARIQTVYSIAQTLTSSSGVVTVDLARGQIFNLTTTEDITQFTLVGVRANAAQSFTIKITQGSTPRNVGVATFKTAGGSDIPVLFPGGGLLPTVSVSAGATDIYSFMTFDGGQSLYGVVGGQNFS